ncbi:SUKH-4 family immunity protein [Yinghuangia soli]|uniref:SUKH-4 family immunity protein n=1 Tax=Yinghuangia soli TaxID=2908204 RepID=A0AA41Q5A8_9ACTN|nr:SUKH-4 family immunity protein [Yinghuangia soli]MCF2530397.1 SUKH-4 family immunity protein [Yinghuangia soli]
MAILDGASWAHWGPAARRRSGAWPGSVVAGALTVRKGEAAVVTAAESGLIRVYDAGTGEPFGPGTRTGLGHVLVGSAGAANPSDAVIVLVDRSGAGEIVAPDSFEHRSLPGSGRTGEYVAAAADARGVLAVLPSRGAGLAVVDPESGETAEIPLGQHAAQLTAVTAFSADGELHATVLYRDGSAETLALRTGTQVAQWTAHEPCRAAAAAVLAEPGRDPVLAAIGSRSLRLWNPMTGQESSPAVELGEREGALHVTLRRTDEDGVVVAWCAYDKVFRAVPATGERLATLDLGAPVRFLAYRDDGALLVAGAHGIAAMAPDATGIAAMTLDAPGIAAMTPDAPGTGPSADPDNSAHASAQLPTTVFAGPWVRVPEDVLPAGITDPGARTALTETGLPGSGWFEAAPGLADIGPEEDPEHPGLFDIGALGDDVVLVDGASGAVLIVHNGQAEPGNTGLDAFVACLIVEADAADRAPQGFADEPAREEWRTDIRTRLTTADPATAAEDSWWTLWLDTQPGGYY